MKKLLIVILFAIISLEVSGQALAKPISRSFMNNNSLQFELFGHGLLYSINYERVLINGQQFKTTAQGGLSYYPPSTGLRTVWIPLSINQLISFNEHHLELGLGHIFTQDYTHTNRVSKWEPLGSLRLGYRYQKPEARFLFRVGFTPMIEYVGVVEYKKWNQLEIYPLGGIAVGYNF
jgi:hypothetical protein